MARRRVIDRFWSKVEKTDTCWLWLGSKHPSGYAAMSVENRSRYVHRLSYELFVGPIPEGLTIDHLCRVRNCVNPNHLEPVTAAENTRRARAYDVKPTHCPQGHEYTPDNIVPSQRSLRCRECQNASNRAYHHSHRKIARQAARASAREQVAS